MMAMMYKKHEKRDIVDRCGTKRGGCGGKDSCHDILTRGMIKS